MLGGTFVHKVITPAALAAALFFAGGAAAKDTETSNDLKCVAVFSVAASQDADSKTTMAAGVGVFYFLGRIEGRAPGFDIESGLRLEANKLTVPTAVSELNRCAAVLTSKAEELQAIGSGMQSMPNLKPDT